MSLLARMKFYASGKDWRSMNQSLIEHPLAFKPPQNPDGEEGSRFWQAHFAEQAHWAAVRRQMRHERKFLTRRNTRGLPAGLPSYVRGQEKTNGIILNQRARVKLARPSKFARRVASSFNTQAVSGFEILYT